MTLILRGAFLLTAQSMLIVSLAGPVSAQDPSDAGAPQPAPPSTGTPPPAAPAAAPALNVAKLPVDLSRLQRRLRDSAERSLQDGQNLKVFVDVYAFAPPLRLFTREDIFGDGQVPGGAPTHQQIMDQNTPEEHRGSGVVRKGGIRILGGKK
jgi:hypothetical protein